jgi:hypothetical protein
MDQPVNRDGRDLSVTGFGCCQRRSRAGLHSDPAATARLADIGAAHGVVRAVDLASLDPALACTSAAALAMAGGPCRLEPTHRGRLAGGSPDEEPLRAQNRSRFPALAGRPRPRCLGRDSRWAAEMVVVVQISRARRVVSWRRWWS